MNSNSVMMEYALGMSRGESMREICPVCGGGSTHEKSLSVTLDDRGYLLWHCYRASCGHSGRKLLWGVVGESAPSPKKRPRAFTGALEPIPTSVLEWFDEEFELKPKTLDALSWQFAPEVDRVYIPIIGNAWEFRGSILRQWKNPLTPKTDTYKYDLDKPLINWMPERVKDGKVILVEDCISAAKLYQCGYNAIALLGTHLSLAMVREIMVKYSHAIIALDKDATSKAVTYVGTFRHLLSLSMWKLEKDLKYVKEERIREAYNGKADFSRSD